MAITKTGRITVSTTYNVDGTEQERDGVRKRRELGPIGGIVAFAVLVVGARTVALLLRSTRLGPISSVVVNMTGIAELVILPLAYLFNPHIFSREFWHLGRNTWNWLLGLALLIAIGLIFRRSHTPWPIQDAVGAVFLGSPLEEIVRAILILPVLRSWGKPWTIIIAVLATSIVHPDPLAAFIPQLFLTLMFVNTGNSILSSSIGHALLNVAVVLSAGITFM